MDGPSAGLELHRFLSFLRQHRRWGAPLTLAVALACLGVGTIAVRQFDAPLLLVLALILAALAVPLALVRPEVFVFAGLVLVSFDRVLAVEIGPLTLKPGLVCFGYALAGALWIWVRGRRSAVLDGIPRLLLVSTLGLLALYVLATVASPRPLTGARKLIVIGGGSVVPALAILASVTSKRQMLTALKFFLLGQFVIALYALYEFPATYLGLPTAVPYYGPVGTVSRATAFSFEPAYYAAYVILGLPLLFSDIWQKTRRLARIPPSLIGIVVLLALLLTVSRAGFVALPGVFIGLWIFGSSETSPGRGKLLRRLIVPLASVALVLGVLAMAAGFDLVGFARERLSSIIDPSEAASNAPRIVLYQGVREVILDHPVIGIGPGSLGYVLPEYGLPSAPGQEHLSTASNIWLEGAAEAGLGTIPLTGLLLASVGYLTFRRSSLEAKALALGAFLFLTIFGALVSFLWDMKVWAVVALALVAHRWGYEPQSARGQPAETSMVQASAE